ncbi:MAG: L-lactate permease, partial [Bdellovibrionales bacterium]|nr:L-lactate permease [Bdellovibrionales bacterium]
RTAFLQAVAGSISFWLGLRNLFSDSELKTNFLWIFFGFLSCAVPYVLMGLFSSEFPTAVAGMFSLAVLLLFILSRTHKETQTPAAPFEFRSVGPLLAVILFLGLLRWPTLPLKEFLRTGNSFLSWESATLGRLSLSSSLVFFWDQILGTRASTQLRLLYNPFLFPFILLSLWMLKAAGHAWGQSAKLILAAGKKAKRPTMIFVSTSVFVGVLSVGGSNSSLMVVGQFMAEVFGDSWALFSATLGAFGAFISGSNTVSNLTFGPMQLEVARLQSLPKEWILALQNVGGGVGYMVNFGSLALICSALGLKGVERKILRFTFRVVVIYLTLVSLLGWLLTSVPSA